MHIYVFVCASLLSCVCGAHARACMYVGQRSTFSFTIAHPPYVLTLELLARPAGLFALLSTGVPGPHHRALPLHGYWEFESGSRAYTANTLATE